jgi:hypothetical protein
MASLLYAGSAAVNVPGGLAAAPLATPAPGNENRRFADCSPHPWGSPLRGQHRCCPKLLPAILSSAFSLRLSGRARSYIPVGHALSAHPCASPRPAVNASAIFCRTGPLPPATLRPDRGTGVDSPLKSANRRPDDKGWTPWMAARGEARQGRRVEPTAGRRSGGERSAKHRFRRGAAGIDKGGPAVPLITFTGGVMPYSAEHEVNGTIPPC